jgi:L-arabinose isomerase
MKTANLPRPKAGLLALSLELYETLAPGLRPSREHWVRQDLMPVLAQRIEVVFPGAVFREEDIGATLARFEAECVDAVIVLLIAYAPSQVSLAALQRTRLPLLIWNTQELRAVDDSFSLDQLFANHGVHGTQDLANVLLRCEVKFHYVTSHVQDVQGEAEIIDFCQAAAAANRLRSAKVGLLGYPFPGMGDFAVDTTHLRATLGCSWTLLTIEDYVQRSAGASTAAVEQLAADYRRSYRVAADITTEDLNATARAEIALRGMIADHRLDAITYQFLAFGDDERTSTLPFVAASRLMAEGLGFGGEGDLIAAAATAFLQWLQPPATFSEIFTIDFAGNSLFMSHMGEANVAMARSDRPVPLVARPTPITRTRDRQLALVTSLAPGTATLVALALGPQNRWRLITAPVTVADFGPLPNLCVPHFKITPGMDVRQFLTAYANAGGPHHNCICYGDARRRLRLASWLLGAEYIELTRVGSDRQTNSTG